MALHLIDGLPGSGKTQYAIKRAIELATRDEGPGRPVFFDSGTVEGRKTFRLTAAGRDKLGWTAIEADDWAKCPDGAIIFLDEVQLLWPVRPSGSKVPEAVAGLATHRHRGFDFFIITQDGSLIDQNVRKIVNPYTHLERPQNQQYSKVWEFSQWCSWGEGAEQAKAQVSRLAFDKGIWGLYESATVHTYKGKVPRRVLWLFPAVVAIIGGGWYGWQTLSGMAKDKALKDATTKSAAAAGGSKKNGGTSTAGPLSKSGERQRKQPMQEWVEDRRPRVPELPHTAPLYDDLTRPVTFPLVSACVQRIAKDECTCYSQQGTMMNVKLDFCLAYVKYGSFDHFRYDPSRGLSNERSGVASRPGAVPASGFSGPVAAHVNPGGPASGQPANFIAN